MLFYFKQYKQKDFFSFLEKKIIFQFIKIQSLSNTKTTDCYSKTTNDSEIFLELIFIPNLVLSTMTYFIFIFDLTFDLLSINFETSIFLVYH
jgi:hypothetical protein